ncbi:hypothetical protein BpHYR1_048687 [Brachionus plicatilis]|uniref:Uncharacterized protein n=1 Tax=Brachionus plicatilis TaxID=10195 RepID=A0A3M7S511_BRAPC|nr:hypothetical protein BpHYR1_048687 [Brachionus plicatilis]
MRSFDEYLRFANARNLFLKTFYSISEKLNQYLYNSDDENLDFDFKFNFFEVKSGPEFTLLSLEVVDDWLLANVQSPTTSNDQKVQKSTNGQKLPTTINTKSKNIKNFLTECKISLIISLPCKLLHSLTVKNNYTFNR